MPCGPEEPLKTSPEDRGPLPSQDGLGRGHQRQDPAAGGQGRCRNDTGWPEPSGSIRIYGNHVSPPDEVRRGQCCLIAMRHLHIRWTVPCTSSREFLPGRHCPVDWAAGPLSLSSHSGDMAAWFCSFPSGHHPTQALTAPLLWGQTCPGWFILSPTPAPSTQPSAWPLSGLSTSPTHRPKHSFPSHSLPRRLHLQHVLSEPGFLLH